MYYSDLVDVGDFRHLWTKAFLSKNERCEDVELPENEVPTVEKTFPRAPEGLEDELAEMCGINSLSCEGETPGYDFANKKIFDGKRIISSVNVETDLSTLKMQEQRLKAVWSNKNLRKTACKYKKHSISETLLQTSEELDDEEISVPVDSDEILLSVLVCPSTNPDKLDPFAVLRAGGIKYLVLGNQLLTDLRDKIFCPADYTVPGDFSDDPINITETKAKDLYTSAFFFINNVFYNDLRDATSFDYSKVILDWASSDQSRNAEPYRSQPMDNIYFNDLSIRIGYPYLFMHQGNCQHIMVFTDLRLISKGDCMDKEKYPLTVSSRKKKKTVCMICHQFSAKWVTRNNPRLPMRQFLFCEKCFLEFNYDAEGKKIGNFTAQPFLDRVALL